MPRGCDAARLRFPRRAHQRCAVLHEHHDTAPPIATLDREPRPRHSRTSPDPPTRRPDRRPPWSADPRPHLPELPATPDSDPARTVRKPPCATRETDPPIAPSTAFLPCRPPLCRATFVPMRAPGRRVRPTCPATQQRPVNAPLDDGRRRRVRPVGGPPAPSGDNHARRNSRLRVGWAQGKTVTRRVLLTGGK